MNNKIIFLIFILFFVLVSYSVEGFVKDIEFQTQPSDILGFDYMEDNFRLTNLDDLLWAQEIYSSLNKGDCYTYFLQISENKGQTISEYLSQIFKTNIKERLENPLLPESVFIDGQKFLLKWLPNEKKWEYIDSKNEKRTVYGGEEIYFNGIFSKNPAIFKPCSSIELGKRVERLAYFLEVSRLTNNIIENGEEEILNIIPKESDILVGEYCAAYIKKIFEHLFGYMKLQESGVGLKGDAWDFKKNILMNGGKIIYDFNPYLDYDLNDLLPGDIIGFYYGDSNWKKTAEREMGDNYITHVALYLGEKEGFRWITHIYQGKIRVEDINSFLSSQNGLFKLKLVLRPNPEILWENNYLLSDITLKQDLEKKMVEASKMKGHNPPELIAKKILQFSSLTSPEYLTYMTAFYFTWDLSGDNPLEKWKLECKYRSLFTSLGKEPTTYGPAQMKYHKAIYLAKKYEGKEYTKYEMIDILCSSSGEGLKYTLLLMDEMGKDYLDEDGFFDLHYISFLQTDYHMGEFSRRNMAIQDQVSKLTGLKLARDGDILRYYDESYVPSDELSQSAKAILTLLEKEGMKKEDILEDLKKEKDLEFEDTPTYKKIKEIYKSKFGKDPEKFAYSGNTLKRSPHRKILSICKVLNDGENC